MSFGFWPCKTNVQVLPIAVSGFIQTFVIFRPYLNLEGESSTQKADIERFCQLIKSDVSLMSGSEFEISCP